MLHWLQANSVRAIDLFRKFDLDQDNRLSCDDFTIGMRLLEVLPVMKQLMMLPALHITTIVYFMHMPVGPVTRPKVGDQYTP